MAASKVPDRRKDFDGEDDPDGEGNAAKENSPYSKYSMIVQVHHCERSKASNEDIAEEFK